MNNKTNDSIVEVRNCDGNCSYGQYSVTKAIKLDRFPELKQPTIELMRRVIDGMEQLNQTQAFLIGQLLKELE